MFQNIVLWRSQIWHRLVVLCNQHNLFFSEQLMAQAEYRTDFGTNRLMKKDIMKRIRTNVKNRKRIWQTKFTLSAHNGIFIKSLVPFPKIRLLSCQREAYPEGNAYETSVKMIAGGLILPMRFNILLVIVRIVKWPGIDLTNSSSSGQKPTFENVPT